jgi:putative endonuclease
MFIVFVISSTGRSYVYVGLTSNLADRLHRHNSGYERTTRPYRPFELIYQQEFGTRLEARAHEKLLKTTSGKRSLLSR